MTITINLDDEQDRRRARQILRVSQSIVQPNMWLLDLECGHRAMFRSRVDPTRYIAGRCCACSSCENGIKPSKVLTDFARFSAQVLPL